MIYRSTEKHVIGKSYGLKDEQAAKARYKFLSSVLKALMKLLVSNQC